ncbi:MAG: pseudouridine synthase [Lachnospiraceae bacterium]|jgi:23S rRNA pseudouridine2604 synthase|nr:pseudouridine synthase [Lachnospiraceae bacterium]
MYMEKERLNKYLASCGVCSRREADRLIEEGQVTVNGAAAQVGTQVDSTDKITVRGKLLHGKEEKVVFAYYKPVGVVCTERDKFADKKISDMVHFPVRVTYAGRLDKDSEGLLLLTNDGALIEAMMRGSSGHEKEYIVRLNKEVTDEFVSKMASGVYLRELKVKTRPCRVEKVGKFTFRIVLTQGLNRQIKRMAQELGYHVSTIRRVRVVNVQLAGLQSGQFRQLKGEELDTLYRTCLTQGKERNG